MRVLLLKSNKIESFILPMTVFGNYWIQDRDNNGLKRNLVNAEADNNRWKLKSNFDVQILLNNNYQEFVYLQPDTLYVLTIKGEKQPFILYCMNTYDNNMQQLLVPDNSEITIGKKKNQAIVYSQELIADSQVKLTYNQGLWVFTNLNPACNIYVNNLTEVSCPLKSGDIIFIMGLKLVILGNTIFMNNPNNLATYKMNALSPIPSLPMYKQVEYVEDEDMQVYENQDYFFRAPRFRTSIEPTEIKIDAPPEREKEDKLPLIYTIGPMLTMGMTSMVTGITTLSSVLDKKQTLESALPSLVVAGAMLMSMLVWPLLSKRYERHQRKKHEKLRQKKYKAYIESKKQEIIDTITAQRNVLIENLLPLEECEKIILEKKRNLWERKIDQADFLNLRVGIGDQEPKIKISYPEAHFTLEEDNLRPILDEVVATSQTITEVPFDVNFVNEYIAAIVGPEDVTTKFIAGLFLQMLTFHSYEELKIVIFTTKENAHRWDYLKVTPFCFNDDRTIRFFATDTEEANQISNYLNDIFISRAFQEDELDQRDYRNFSTYYVILTDDFASIRNLDIVRSVLGQKVNYGFSFIINNEKLLGLPNECRCFLSINAKIKSTVFGNELIVNQQKEFMADLQDLDMEVLCQRVSNIPIELAKGKYTLPKSISFLEMYDVGKVEQLNPLNRWKTNNPVTSLQASVGVDENGELFKLDLHEKFHGPHGLVAGMTGSGKSEFLITYILSMAINYDPNEVAFVLIDYKGGGLAGAFENRETGIKLPHLAGTITNLDTVEMNRALASIQSELKRRQKVFNKARELLNESTIDIYKYQKLYRAGAVKEPIPHLFIISDEFAELKTQQPEFMEQLISTARIGRSLGVHLILATQKPSGVVDDQIWSNSRFRVCLKVQEKSDSVDMIKRPDAATLKNVGRFYLQVGYNEFFAMGQSAWCGAPYVISDKRKKVIDTNLDIINSVGYVLKSINHEKKELNIVKSGEELPNIVNYLSVLAKQQNIVVPQLWLPRLPDVILVNYLKQKYQYQAKKHVINPIIGEYDDPANQQQHLLTLPLSLEGNTIVYGAVGSGKEDLISTLLYSTILEHSVEEVNFYILDFGAETLKNFIDAPQVGDVLLSNDNEKIQNLFKMLSEIIEKRKKLFVEYNGNYQNYCERSGKIIPTIIVVINYFEAFQEMYPEFEDIVISLTREGLKYGIIFILTTNGTNSIRYRLRQNFKLELVLQMNEQDDYTAVLGNVHGMHPSKIKGRGLIKTEEIYEFQTAYASQPESLVTFIKDFCMQLRATVTTKAQSIPVLPEEVTLPFLQPHIFSMNNLPIGVEKETLNIVKVPFMDRYMTYVTAIESESFEGFLPNLIMECTMVPNTITVVVDSEKLLTDEKFDKVVYYKNNWEEVYHKLERYFDQVEQIKQKNEQAYEKLGDFVCIIVGLDQFKNNLPQDLQNNLSNLLVKGKNIGKVTFIVFDTLDKMKKVEYEPWYKECTNNTYGIWIGNGIGDQFTLKLSKTPRSIREDIDESFGYYVKMGNPILIKLLGKKDMDE